MKIKTALILPDFQTPFENKRSVKAVEQFMASKKWDLVVYLGDFVDNFSIARYNEGKPGLLEGKSIQKELQYAEKVLARQVNIIRKKNPAAEITFLEGNHEARAYEFIHRNPTFRGLIEPELALELDEKNIKYVRSWSTDEVYRIGKAVFTHGNYTNDHHAKKMVLSYGENVFYGHVHDCNSYNMTSRGNNKTKVAQAMGCLCEYPKGVDYTKGAPKNWQQAFGIFYFLPDGTFTYQLVRIVNNRFVVEGKLYQG